MDETIRILLTYGPGGVIAALVIFGVLVPKGTHEREIKRGDSAISDNAKNAESLKVVSDALRVVTETNVDLKNEIIGLKAEVATVVRDFREFRIGRKDGNVS